MFTLFSLGFSKLCPLSMMTVKAVYKTCGKKGQMNSVSNGKAELTFSSYTFMKSWAPPDWNNAHLHSIKWEIKGIISKIWYYPSLARGRSNYTNQSHSRENKRTAYK